MGRNPLKLEQLQNGKTFTFNAIQSMGDNSAVLPKKITERKFVVIRTKDQYIVCKDLRENMYCFAPWVEVTPMD